MSTELVTLQNELMIERQRNEIMQLKFNLQKLQAEKTSRLEDSLFSPALFPHYQKVAETLAKSNVIPFAYKAKPEDIFVAMAMGYQLGFPVEQSLQDIAVINGRPCLWGDGLMALVLNHPECERIDEKPLIKDGQVVGYTCTVLRKGHEPHQKSFTMQDAQQAGLWGKKSSNGTPSPWCLYPERMMQMRARSLALRDKFADALRGLRIAEVEQDDDSIIDGEVIDQPTNDSTMTSQTDRVKARLKQARKGNEKTVNEPIESNDVDSSALDDSKNTEETSEGADNKPLGETGTTKNPVHYTGKDDEPISDEQLDEISTILQDKKFTEERKQKALKYFNVNELEELSDAQARLFLLQLGKLK